MSPAPRYEIATVADFAKVPPKRLRACLKEFALAIEMARATEKLLEAVHDDLHPQAAPIGWAMKTFTWIDDKQRTATIRLLEPESP